MVNHRLALVILLAIAVMIPGCARQTADGPAAPSEKPPATAVGFPAISAPGRIYLGTPPPSSSSQVGGYDSRYVLYDNGSFALQYATATSPFFEYRGKYTQSGATLTFTWEGWSAAGPWGSTGTLEGDTLTVKYNLIMQLSDFVDGTYVRVPQ